MQGYSNALDHIILMMRHAHDKEQCAKLCCLSGQHCNSIVWNERQKSCILDNAGENDFDEAATWVGWITCVRGKHDKCHIIVLCNTFYTNLPTYSFIVSKDCLCWPEFSK